MDTKWNDYFMSIAMVALIMVALIHKLSLKPRLLLPLFLVCTQNKLVQMQGCCVLAKTKRFSLWNMASSAESQWGVKGRVGKKDKIWKDELIVVWHFVVVLPLCFLPHLVPWSGLQEGTKVLGPQKRIRAGMTPHTKHHVIGIKI